MSDYYAIGDHVFRAEDVEQAGTSAHAHPVVVIDPEDREQVERLADAVLVEASGHRIDKAILTVGLTKGLTEFANPTPPKPEEPTGLGAVVEDAEGAWWVQFSSKTGDWWRNHQGQNLRYADIKAVRILSEGVTA